MVTSVQLAFTQFPISSLTPSVRNTVTVKLDYSNYVTWNFQMDLLLEGNGIVGFVNGYVPCPDKFEHSDSEKKQLITITLSRMCTNIVQLKIDLQNIKKDPESVDPYLQKIKESRDQLVVAGVTISDEDIVIVALRGLPSEYYTIKAVICGRENLVSLKELRSQLKAEETTLDETTKQISLMSTMFTQASGSSFDHGGSS
ncbi:uncharacterized protein [Malus domestica]|uniref:uncharacterized protein n=1 Tax=Malus domestica TaxID=3750 RepID=UPI0039760773